MNAEQHQLLLTFIQIVNRLTDKYPHLSDSIKSRDPEMFLLIPQLLLLQALQSSNFELCLFLNPLIQTNLDKLIELFKKED